jgi:hypothetical protein
VNDIVTIHDIEESKTELQLSNYPNPAKDQTTIVFTMDKKGPVTMELWDQCGRKLKTLVQETMDAGKHEVSVDVSQLRSAIYYYTLYSGKKRKTNKLIVLK